MRVHKDKLYTFLLKFCDQHFCMIRLVLTIWSTAAVHKMSSCRRKLSLFSANLNKANNVGSSRKNAGMQNVVKMLEG